MSSISWSGNRLVQRVGGQEDVLGYLEAEPNSQTCALWLKDTFGVAGTPGTAIRADLYPSVDVAKEQALNAPSVFIWHLIWMRGIVKHQAERELDEYWEELTTDTKNSTSKASIQDRLRGYFDRLPADNLKELSEKVGSAVFTQTIVETIKNFLFGD